MKSAPCLHFACGRCGARARAGRRYLGLILEAGRVGNKSSGLLSCPAEELRHLPPGAGWSRVGRAAGGRGRTPICVSSSRYAARVR